MSPAGATMPEWLGRRALLSPDRPALWFAGQRWSFRELAERSADTARRLARLGVGPGDRVAVLLQNGPAFVFLVHAAARLGAVLVPLNTRLAPPELAWQLEDAGVALLVYDAANAARAVEAASGVPGLRLVVTGPAGGEGGDATPLETVPPRDIGLRDLVELQAPHTIIYTAGTTGRPKGALLTYGNHWWSAVGSALNLGIHADDRWLCCLPLFHVGGLSILWRSVIYGTGVVLHSRFDPAAVNEALDAQGVTIVSAVSTMLAEMLAARGARPYPPTLRCVLLGGGPAPPALLEACRALGVPVVTSYGLTETASQAATLAPEDGSRMPGAAGKPLFPTEIRVVRGDLPAAPGEVGEIQVRGPTVSPGYVNSPAPGAPGGWLTTGDVGYLDGEGYLYVVDRRDDLIVSGGENVYPAEVEAVLVALEGVADAGVVGIPDARWGQVPMAWVVPRPGAALDEATVLAHCRRHLGGYKVPVRVRFAGALPRNAMGKLLRRVLREWSGAQNPGGAASDVPARAESFPAGGVPAGAGSGPGECPR